MQANPKRPIESASRGVQRVILALVVEAYPTNRTRSELAWQTNETPAAVAAALKALERSGLVEVYGESGETVRPTVAARACHRLEAW
jgi:DNA-binding MarR family transcriptional regulator